MPPHYIFQPPLQLNWACVTSSNSLWVEVTYVISRLKYLIAAAQPSCFPGGAVVKNPPANAGDTRDADLIPGLGRSPGVGNGNPLQYSCLEKLMDRRARWATVHGVAKCWTWLNTCVHTHTHTHTHTPSLSPIEAILNTLGWGGRAQEESAMDLSEWPGECLAP